MLKLSNLRRASGALLLGFVVAGVTSLASSGILVAFLKVLSRVSMFGNGAGSGVSVCVVGPRRGNDDVVFYWLVSICWE